MLIRGRGLLECDCVIIPLVNGIEELLQRRVALNGKQNHVASAKVEVAVIDERAPIFGNGHLNFLLADVLSHLGRNRRRRIRIIKRKAGRQFDCYQFQTTDNENRSGTSGR